jgi:hypothetical protein
MSDSGDVCIWDNKLTTIFIFNDVLPLTIPYHNNINFYYDDSYMNHRNNRLGANEVMVSIDCYDGSYMNHRNNRLGANEVMVSIDCLIQILRS